MKSVAERKGVRMETANVGGGFKKGEVREHMPPLSLSICYDAVSSLCIPSFPLFHSLWL